MDPLLTLFVREGCDFCREAEELLSAAGIPYVRRRITRLHAGVILIWDDKGNVLERVNEGQIPGTPALLIRDRTPPMMFVTYEQIVAYVVGRTWRGPATRHVATTLDGDFQRDDVRA